MTLTAAERAAKIRTYDELIHLTVKMIHTDPDGTDALDTYLDALIDQRWGIIEGIDGC